MLDASLHYIVMRRYPDRLAERAGKIMNRQLCNFGEHFQSDIFLQMRIYVFAARSGAGGCSDLGVELAAAYGIKLEVSKRERLELQTVIDPILSLFVCTLSDGPLGFGRGSWLTS